MNFDCRSYNPLTLFCPVEFCPPFKASFSGSVRESNPYASTDCQLMASCCRSKELTFERFCACNSTLQVDSFFCNLWAMQPCRIYTHDGMNSVPHSLSLCTHAHAYLHSNVTAEQGMHGCGRIGPTDGTTEDLGKQDCRCNDVPPNSAIWLASHLRVMVAEHQ